MQVSMSSIALHVFSWKKSGILVIVSKYTVEVMEAGTTVMKCFEKDILMSSIIWLANKNCNSSGFE